MRSVGVGALGVIGGTLLALIVYDFVAAASVRLGVAPVDIGIALEWMIPVFAALGAVVAVVLYRRSVKRRSDGSTGV